MGKKHDTFEGEQPEMPLHKNEPEIKQPHDPAVPEIPQEDPDRVPKELPKKDNTHPERPNETP